MTALAVLALATVACGPAEDTPAPAGEAPAAAPAEAARPAAGAGTAAIAELQEGDATLTGTVTYVGQVPTLSPIAMDADPECAAKHDEPVA
ncbi:MAG TPA: hypothetical protein VLF66_00315, partial [Thermoanaerobaculia bacterium]|nr:hypothetical protein [Thermoanaerobaculia bacterium]